MSAASEPAASTTNIPTKRFPEILRKVLIFLSQYEVIATNSILLAVTGGIEQLLEFHAFRCPSDPTTAKWYSVLFVIGPAIIAFVVAMLWHKRTWLICHGCCSRKKPPKEQIQDPLKPVQSQTTKPGTRTKDTHCDVEMRPLWMVILQAFLVPAAWVCFCLLDGHYFACFNSEPCTLTEFPAEAENGTAVSSTENVKSGSESSECLRLRALSQIGFWILSIAIAAIAFLIICCTRCRSRNTYMEQQYAQILRKEEMRVLKEEMMKQAKNVAEGERPVLQKVDKFTKRDWQLLTLVEPLPRETIQKLKEERQTPEEDQDYNRPVQAWISYRDWAPELHNYTQTEETLLAVSSQG